MTSNQTQAPTSGAPSALLLRPLGLVREGVNLLEIPSFGIAAFPCFLPAPITARALGVAVNSRQSTPSRNTRMGLYRADAPGAISVITRVIGGTEPVQRSDLFSQTSWDVELEQPVEIPAGVYYIVLYNGGRSRVEVATYESWINSYNLLNDNDFGGVMFEPGLEPAGDLPEDIDLGDATGRINRGGVLAALHV